MSNVPLMFQPLVKYVDFQGRARRSEFWLWVLFRMIAGAVCGTIGSMMFVSGLNMQHPDPQMFMSHYFTVMPLFSLLNLLLLLPSYAVGVRRLHDIGRTGWWLAMPFGVCVISVLGFLIFCGTQIFHYVGHTAKVSEAEGFHLVLSFLGVAGLCLLPILMAELVMLVFFTTEGQRKPNRFGPDPKGEALNDTP